MKALKLKSPETLEARIAPDAIGSQAFAQTEDAAAAANQSQAQMLQQQLEQQMYQEC